MQNTMVMGGGKKMIAGEKIKNEDLGGKITLKTGKKALIMHNKSLSDHIPTKISSSETHKRYIFISICAESVVTHIIRASESN